MTWAVRPHPILVVAVAFLFAAAPARAGLSFVPAYKDSTANPVTAPIYLTGAPGDPSRLFVVERGGRIRVAVDGVIQDTPFLDISSEVSTSGEGGLLSMAFPDDYATSKRFFVYFIRKSDGYITIEQFTRSAADPNVADPTSESLLLDVAHPTYTNHYGGQLQWGPGNLLYAGTGDGGGANDPSGNAQNPASRLGKLLAIDPANPGSATVVALGLRNPFRWSFDRGAPNIVIGDVGQDAQEEIDWVPTAGLSGSNFGWSCWEGNNHLISSCNPANYVPPVYTYVNSPGSNPPVAITGGVVVRDQSLAPLVGRYVYADSYAGVLHSQVLATPSSTDDRVEADLPKVAQIVAFGEDADNHVYVVSLNGPVYRITYTAPPGPAPPDPAPPSQPGPIDTVPTATPPLASPALTDNVAPRLTVHRRRIQPRGAIRVAVTANEDCFVRVSGRGVRGALQHVAAGSRTVFALPRTRRLQRTTKLVVRARDGAGNLATRSLVVRVKR